MRSLFRVLDERPCAGLADYIGHGGGDALHIARSMEPLAVVGVIAESGLRGRGGAGFPTATKWRSVLANASNALPFRPTTVVINAAEGEPSTFKDRTILRNNVFRVLEGALVACHVVAAEELVVAIKATFELEVSILDSAIDELRGAGWLEGIDARIVKGPSSYLFGEETAMLEVVSHRHPFPRVSPPWRRGVDEATEGGGAAAAASAELAGTTETVGAPALVNNVETFANVALIVAHGAPWFREVGTQDSPGTIVCTVVGDTLRHGVAEFAMGTTLRNVIIDVGGGAREGRRLIAVLPGASSAIIGEAALDTPLTHEALHAAGSGLGSAGFFCIDDAADTFALAHGASRFLSVESCGQCVPCKDDGLAVTTLLAGLLDGTAAQDVSKQIGDRLATITKGARCSLAMQQQEVIGSLVALCATTPVLSGVEVIDGDESGRAERQLGSALRPLLDIIDGQAVLDDSFADKQPDWSYDSHDSGLYPVQRLSGQTAFGGAEADFLDSVV
jgi:NADH-quinone oxidoreductase subunit F